MRSPFFRATDLRMAPLPLTLLAAAALLTACGGGSSSSSKAATATLAVLETTDLHYNVRSYDYFKLADDPSYGFERTATLIRQARSDFANTLLVDNGDTIQGTALADYEAQVAPIACEQQLSMYKAMAVFKFDAGTLGNHEFNYGLPFLNQVLGGGLQVDGVDASKKCAGPGYPMALANVLSSKTNAPLVAPYVLLEREVSGTDSDGKAVKLPIKIGVIGFTTPGIMGWDKRHLEGKVQVTGAVEAAQKYVPELRSKGADVVVALLHGGLDASEYRADMENPGLYLSKVAGIDAMVMGHQHSMFPDTAAQPAFSMAGVDNKAGTINGVPAVMASSWGKALGVVALSLKWDGKAWSVDKSQSKSELRSTTTGKDAAGKTTYVAVDSSIAPVVESQHQAAISYVKTPVGQTDFRMGTQFADVGDAGAIQLVNQAQQDYVQRYVQANLPQYAQLPVLSVSAPFKSGFQGGGDYTDVAAGPLAIYNAADLYLYPNTVYAVKVNGAQIKSWLEAAAQRFNRIDPAATADQWLISSFPGYNFDMFTTADMQYQIDVTQAVGSRVVGLQYKGAPIDPAQDFVIATNNYRATSGKSFLPELDGRATIYASPDANRDVVISYIKEHPQITRAANGAAQSWRFAKTPTAGKVLFTSAANALPVAQAAGLANISLEKADDGTGTQRAVYRVDLGL
ncbi:bifunctional 2',3'-cyclic-nucleotide 2'-phosphodiesterase/3'-nucleotidase [Comamonas piscis]|uniref:Bifunctional 2',3'-cyclic-nucleotide 2'-phosphodiesterase/3'-nucleotidase n=1 Tax=Comamonas piscis TaxID=1562974 RepID=A0A7G5EBV8_9BURK|nr:bifunctional 2',3'-cyclic-nucleotide 2'-phosphodiesterase/3'-nucleotidase [Comamonas piscis]QMV71483.1 bifunctional 2',3'-cyclic-nucleotide 2'-phosphodiesterase/3'-nucleotidase [Comamonas piscis]WSO34195.1 bifunctional 2',3'-cyclic-nucleotide 2'-phosphodiesterase/3'-nucleotidase [Comamonas piscis]